MPGIDELLREAGEQWRADVDTRSSSSSSSSRHEPAPRAARAWDSPHTRLYATGAALAAAAVVVLVVDLASGSSSEDSGGSSMGVASVASGEAAGSASSAAGEKAAAPAASAPSAAPSSAGSTALIQTGTLSLTVASNGAVDTAATRATGIADAAGGRVDDDSRSSDGKRSATLVLRVPNAALSGVTAQLSALGTVSSRNLQTKDVTSQVADVNSRVTSARAAIAALNRLYAKAQSTKDLITIESALASRQSNLESLEAQQRSLSAQTSLATLTVSITPRSAPAAKSHHRSGFTGGLHGGWHAFTASAQAIATAAGAVLPFAVLALVLGAAGVIGLRRRRV